MFKTSWGDLIDSLTTSVKSVTEAIFILFFIGAVAGTWMISGVVPTLIYYGLKILSPVWTAGAIISGAYFGDKLSHLSDTNVLASSLAGIPLFEHVKYMLYTTVPTFIITLVVFLVVSLTMDNHATLSVQEFSDGIRGTFCISPWLMIVPVLTATLIILKLPALAVLLLSALSVVVAALIAQPCIIAEIGGGSDIRSMFKGVMVTIYGSTSIETGLEQLNELVSTSGMCGMLDTIFLILCTGAFGGVLNGSGIMRVVTDTLARLARGPKSLTAVTEVTGIAGNIICADQYLSILMTISINSKLYEKMGYEQKLLTRTTSNSATVTSMLVPWNSCGIMQATVLGVPTITYLPYRIFNLLAPVMSFVIAATGWKIKKLTIEN